MLGKCAIAAIAWSGLALPLDALAAGNCNVPANRVVNCRFDSNTLDWVAGNNATVVHAPSDGTPLGSGPGSMEIQSGAGMMSFGDNAAAFQCLVVAGATRYEFRADLRLSSGTIVPGGDFGCNFFASQHEAIDCTSGNPTAVSAHPISTPTSTWAESERRTILTDPDTRRIRLDIFCDSAAAMPFSLRVDDVFFVPLGPEIFADGFESGL